LTSKEERKCASFKPRKNNCRNILLKYTANSHAVLTAVWIEIFNSSPDKANDNERRRQRRLVLILHDETVAMESPRLDAFLFHFLVLVAAITNNKTQF